MRERKEMNNNFVLESRLKVLNLHFIKESYLKVAEQIQQDQLGPIDYLVLERKVYKALVYKVLS